SINSPRCLQQDTNIIEPVWGALMNSSSQSFKSGDIPMLFYPQEKLALFIDGANLYGAAKGLAFDIDYKRLLELFARKGVLVRAFYYTAVAEDQEFSPLRPLVDWLDYNGFTVVTKPLKEFTDVQGRRRVKGNMDIELAIDVMEISDA